MCWSKVLQNAPLGALEHSERLSTFANLPFVIQICILSIFESGRFTQILLYFFIKGNSLPGQRQLTDEISGFEKYLENDIKERGEDNAMVADERAPLDSSEEDLKLLRILQNVLDTDVQTGDKRWV